MSVGCESLGLPHPFLPNPIWKLEAELEALVLPKSTPWLPIEASFLEESIEMDRFTSRVRTHADV